MEQNVVRMENICVSYDELFALKGFFFDLFPGEIHAIIGEHGAGKSTMVRLLAGLVRKFSGILEVRGRRYTSFSTKLSVQNNIGIIHQTVKLIPTLTAVENIFTGRFKLSPFHTIKYKEMRTQLEHFLSDLSMDLDLKSPVGMLKDSDRHKVELLRAVYFDPEILIFDEISTKFNQDEIDTAYSFMQKLRETGKSIIYISNNMNEIFEFADRVSVMKGGKVISTQQIKDTDKVKLIDITYSFASTREELRQTNIELYNYKKYNEDIIKNIPIGVTILDEKRNVYLINYAAEQILGCKKQEQKRKIEDVIRKMDSKLQKDILESIESKIIRVWNEIHYTSDSYIKITIFPFRDENYSFLGTILLFEDISKDYFFKNYLIQNERVASIAELAAGVAHEVNNPLSIILNYVELLKLKVDDSYANERLTKIDSELNRIKKIVGSMLSFSHPNDHPMVKVDLRSVMDETLLLLTHEIKKKNACIKWNPPNYPLYVSGNENQLKQVFINLLVNSIEAIDINGKISIRLEQPKKQQYAAIYFSDNGSGIPDQIREKIFNPFFSTKTEKSNTGLGLSICQHIIESHQGIITCTGEKDTNFLIRLPLLQD